jgi:hypothetical protein
MWFLVPLRSQFQLSLPITTGHSLTKITDHGWLELGGGLGANNIISAAGSTLLRFGTATPPALLSKCLVAGATMAVILYLVC